MAREVSEVHSVFAESADNCMMEMVRDAIRESKLDDDIRHPDTVSAPGPDTDTEGGALSAMSSNVTTMKVVTRNSPCSEKAPRNPPYPMGDLSQGELAYSGFPAPRPGVNSSCHGGSGFAKISITGPGVKGDTRRPHPPGHPLCVVRENGVYVTKQMMT
eukprot:Selendium_serpulae@DN6333_c0_g1_i2.p1